MDLSQQKTAQWFSTFTDSQHTTDLNTEHLGMTSKVSRSCQDLTRSAESAIFENFWKHTSGWQILLCSSSTISIDRFMYQLNELRFNQYLSLNHTVLLCVFPNKRTAFISQETLWFPSCNQTCTPCSCFLLTPQRFLIQFATKFALWERETSNIQNIDGSHTLNLNDSLLVLLQASVVN